MKRRDNSSPLYINSIATPAQVNRWDRNRERACTVEEFCLDLRPKSNTEFNASATQVFVDDFLRSDYKCKDSKAVTKMFQSRIRTLKDHLKRHSTTSALPDRIAVTDKVHRFRRQSPTDADKKHSSAVRQDTVCYHAFCLGCGI